MQNTSGDQPQVIMTTPESPTEKTPVARYRVWVLLFILALLSALLAGILWYRQQQLRQISDPTQPPGPLPEGGHQGIAAGPEYPEQPQLLTLDPNAPLNQEPLVSPLPLAKGKQTYFVRNGDKPGPKITQVTISELDPQKNPHIFDVQITSQTAPVAKVTVTLMTDTKREVHDLSLKQGTTNQGTWSGTWSLTDTYQKNYQAEIKAASSEGESVVTLTFR